MSSCNELEILIFRLIKDIMLMMDDWKKFYYHVKKIENQ